ncbi:MAG: hypothetical protein WB989_25165 [Mycobacterium sp.]
MVDTDGFAADVYLASDLDGAVIEARVHEPFVGVPTSELHDRNPKLWVDAQAAFIDPASTSMLTSADVLILLNEFAVTEHQFNETGGTLTKLLSQRVRTPPSWRMQWPHGRLELCGLRNFPLSDNFADRLPAHRPADFTARNILQRHVLWNLPDDELLGNVTQQGVHLPTDVPTLLEFAKWCDEYDRADDAVGLRVSAVEHDAAAVPTTTASELIKALLDIGDKEEDLEKSWWAFQTAAAVAATYWEATGIPAKFLHKALSLKAMFERRWIDAFEYAFTEMFLFQGADHTVDLFAGICQVIRANAPPSDDASAAVNVAAKCYHGSAWGHRRRRRILRECLALWEGIPSGVNCLSVQQYRAEVLTDLFRLGDRQAGEIARQVFDWIIGKFPWFTPAYAQACHLALEQGRIDEARHYLRLGEERDVMHVQLQQARKHLLRRMEGPVQYRMPRRRASAPYQMR